MHAYKLIDFLYLAHDSHAVPEGSDVACKLMHPRQGVAKLKTICLLAGVDTIALCCRQALP